MAQLGRGTPVKPIYTRGWLDFRVPFSSRFDDFTDGVVDTTLWSNFNATSETGGKGVVTCNTLFNGYRTLELFNIQEDSIIVQITPSASGGATTQVINEFLIGTTNTALAPAGTQIDYQIDVLNGQLKAMVQVGFADAGTVSIAYNATTMAWLRIKETGGQLFFDYSATGAPSSWTNLRTTTTPSWIGFANQRVSFQANRSDGTNDTMQIDNYNLGTSDPATPSPIFRPAPFPGVGTRRGQTVYAPKGFHPGEKSPSPLVLSPFSGRKPFPLPPPIHLLKGVDDREPPSSITAVGLDGALQVPLAVRLTNDVSDVLLIAEVKDLSFRSVANGGFASATVTLDRPLNVAAPEILQYGRIYIYDTRTGDTVWEGRLEDPGRSSSSDGRFWQITAVGPSAHARDEEFVYVPIGTELSDWEKFGGSTNSSSVSSSTDASDNDGIKVQFSGGISVATPAYVAARLLTVLNAGTSLASISTTAVGGGTGQWTEEVYAYGPAGAELIDSVPLTTSTTLFRGEVGSDFSAGQTTPHLRMNRTGASAAPDDNAYTFFYNIIIRTLLVDEEGNAVTSYSDDFVTTTQLVQDLVGAHTSEYDGLDAFIEDVLDEITQFWYPDGTTVYDALNDLIALNGAFFWAAWETILRSGKWRFEFRAWPTTVRYEAGVDDGFESPGSATDLYNQVAVHWTDSKGRDRTTVRTLAVDALTRAGLTRSARLDLGKENGSQAAANSAGDAFLQEHNLPSRNGRLTVTRAILDYDRGMVVDPHMIRPGALLRVRDVDPEPNALNPGGRDGNTVFRVVAISYRANDNSAQLDLDTDAVTISRALAKFATQSKASKRRHH